MKTVLLVAEGAAESELSSALAGLDWSVRLSAPREAVEAARTKRPVAIIVTGFADATAARFVSHLVQNLRDDCPPVVVTLANHDSAVRDACLVAGAADVASATAAEETAARVDAAAGEWLRGALRVPFAQAVRAQHVRQAFELRGVDLDLSGLGFEPTDAVQEGQLLRLTLTLPGGDFVAWARVTRVDDGLGARFVGTTTEDRQRLATAVQGVRETTMPPRGTPLVPGPPPAARAAAAPSGTPVVPGPPPAVSRPAPVRPPAMPPPVLSAPAPVEPPTVPPAVTAPEETATESIESVTASATSDDADVPAAPVAEAPAAGERTSLADAIDEELGTRRPANAEADVLEGLLGSALEHRWPQGVPEVDATLASLQTAAMLGLVGEQAGAPPADTVLAFVRTVSPLERRLFDPEPPQELPDATLGIQCLGLRLRLFALARDAEQKLEGADRYAIDEVVIASLKAEVAQLDAALQKLVDGFVTSGQPQRIKDITTFRNALNKAFSDLRRVAGRLRGDADAGGAGSAVFLDVAEEAPGQQQATTVRKDAREPEKKAVDKKPQFARVLSPEQRARRRVVVWSVIGVAALILRIVTLEPSVQRLDADDLDGLAGVVEIAIPPEAVGMDVAKPRAAIVHVTDTWSADELMVAKLKATLRARGVARFTVLGPNGRLMADGRTGPTETVNVLRRRGK